MADPQQALQTQLKNIQAKTGKSLDELAKIVKKCGLTKHGEIRDMLKAEHGLGHGDANTLTHVILKSDGGSATQETTSEGGDVLDSIYTGPKAHMRSIHEALMKKISTFGEFEVAPKKGYVSLRRKKQFAMLGPATNTRFEVGLNVKGLKAGGRLEELPAGGMCNYKVKLTEVSEVNDELFSWIKQAFDSAG
jgi:hypothetical protein